jgi:hypothetical protein
LLKNFGNPLATFLSTSRPPEFGGFSCPTDGFLVLISGILFVRARRIFSG